MFIKLDFSWRPASKVQQSNGKKDQPGSAHLLEVSTMAQSLFSLPNSQENSEDAGTLQGAFGVG